MNLSEVVNFQANIANLAHSRPQYESTYEPETKTLWGWFNPQGTPCFSLALLNDIRAHDSALESHNGHVQHGGVPAKVDYYVVGSRVPGIFNLGGDLALFLMLIKSGERDALAHYSRLCIDNIYPRIRNYHCPTMTTISLIQGDALGGGFETALASDVLVAEENAMIGLPEILFNLFPGMGAYSLLSRRVGPRVAEELITSGRVHTGAELHKMGVVDVVARDGEGEQAVREWIARNQKRRNGFQAVMEARRAVNPITRDELDKITHIWVDAALRLEERDLKMISRLVRSQSRRVAATPGSSPAVAMSEATAA
jgi:DSF synthase